MDGPLESPSGETRLFPILGSPVAYTKSPQRLTRGFASRGANAVCIPMEVPEGSLDAVMVALTCTRNVDGLLVTMPHKAAAFAYCATASPVARLLGCVSVMRRTDDGAWHGDMLDGQAFVRAQGDGGAIHRGARALLVGAGSAGSAIAFALLEAGVRELAVFDSDGARASRLLVLLAGVGHGRVHAGSPDPTGFDIVCNATPLGMGHADPLLVLPRLLKPTMFVGDVVAGHGVTPLIQAARDCGCRTSDGVAMVEAAQEAMLDFFLQQHDISVRDAPLDLSQ